MAFVMLGQYTSFTLLACTFRFGVQLPVQFVSSPVQGRTCRTSILVQCAVRSICIYDEYLSVILWLRASTGGWDFGVCESSPSRK